MKKNLKIGIHIILNRQPSDLGKIGNYVIYTQVHMYFDNMFLGNSCKDFSCSFLYSFIHELFIQLKAKKPAYDRKIVHTEKNTNAKYKYEVQTYT